MYILVYVKCQQAALFGKLLHLIQYKPAGSLVMPKSASVTKLVTACVVVLLCSNATVINSV